MEPMKINIVLGYVFFAYFIGIFFGYMLCYAIKSWPNKKDREK
jgi:predicted membrane protein